MNWTKETVEEFLNNENAINMFINHGFLRLQINEVSLLFFPNTDDTVSMYYEYLPSKNKFIDIENFYLYAIKYLEKQLSQHNKKNLLSSHCINPINID